MSSKTDKTRAKSQSARIARKTEEDRRARQKRLLAIIGGAMAIALIAVAILVAVNRDTNSGTTTKATVVAASTIDPAIPQNGLSIGSTSATVSVIEYGDYQCPYCGNFARTYFPQLLSTYIAPGQVLFTFSPFSFLGDESVAAAEAALCANDQGKFWAMHDALYANQAGENEGAFSSDRLKEIAQTAGLDMTAFNTCMSDGAHKGDVTNYTNAATTAGVSQTPSFSINGGTPFAFSTWDDFDSKIKAALGQ